MKFRKLYSNSECIFACQLHGPFYSLSLIFIDINALGMSLFS